MTRYYLLEEDSAATARHTGDFNATHRWKLPGLLACPGCGATWASVGHYYPADWRAFASANFRCDEHGVQREGP
ncbi:MULTISPECIES: double-CXXCG motif protein [Myxococcus]|uniref:double-CXXCG motif protein n=1 Tax=Myxococcus TaxID=32 RepID=UPI00112EB827|nr:MULTISPECIES: double-CXXCG motif protein [Myxococcus]QDE86680.1 hypothetical protein BHS07_36975 [Myxococcus xanthus]WAM26294.1 double-CXXCG motif protein [Myxococcus sp. NMCA1]